MFFDAGALFVAPLRGVRRNPIGEKAVDHAVSSLRRLSSSLATATIWSSAIKGVDARISIQITGNHPEPEISLRKRVEHLLDRLERIPPARAFGQDQNIGLGSVRFRDIGESLAGLAVAPAAMSARPSASAARCSSQAIGGKAISSRMMRASARSISMSKPVRIETDPMDTSRREGNCCRGCVRSIPDAALPGPAPRRCE
jgi:hypothetical protein